MNNKMTTYQQPPQRGAAAYLRRLAILALFLSLLAAPAAGAVYAQPGDDPAQPGFAYGVTLDPEGSLVEDSVDTAAKLGLDWLAVPLDWSRAQPAPETGPEVGPLAAVLERAAGRQIRVLLSVTAAPSWAMAPTGPDPARTADLVQQMAERYPAIQAVELFPLANTVAGWGAAPDPAAYLEVLRHTHQRVQNQQLELTILAGGLMPAGSQPSPDVVDDLLYLELLYSLGGAQWMPVLSLRLGAVTGTPLETPYGAERRVLRHYELIRQVMLAHNHHSGMIWVTGFSWPSGTINPDEKSAPAAEAQAVWLHEAYNLLSAQLYIGAAFFQSLNPGGESVPTVGPSASLIEATGRLHPGLDNLGRLADSENLPGTLTQISVKYHRSLKQRFKHDP